MRDYIVDVAVSLKRTFLVTAADERRAGELVWAGEEERDGEAVEVIREKEFDTEIIEVNTGLGGLRSSDDRSTVGPA